MPIFKITSRTGGNQSPRLIEAPTRAAALRQLAREQFDITPATVREVITAYHAHLKRRATQPKVYPGEDASALHIPGAVISIYTEADMARRSL